MKSLPEVPISAKEMWRAKLTERFSEVTVATSLFSITGFNLVTGCEDGVARIYQIAGKGEGLDIKPKLELETKSGPIQCLAVHDITRCYNSDLIVGDSCGVLTMFCNRHILSRQSLSAEKDSIICLTVIQDNDNVPVVVCCSDSGVITAVRPNTLIWRLDLKNTTLPGGNKQIASAPVKVLCLTGFYMTDTCGNRRLYLLAADDAKRIHVISKGIIVRCLPTPVNITAMCQGRIVSPHKLEPYVPGEESPEGEQIALGGDNGAVYILDKFDITDEYINTQTPITRLKCIPQADSSTDLLLCAGHFNALQVYKDGFVLMEFETSDWVISIDTADIDEDGTEEVIISCMDNSVLALKINCTESGT
ncbi:serine/threonine-protein kinase pak 6 [Plakobranchus ocellatus]|uniref:Serine/threonine-protein kinase pak 6 n=1 Tax=Plakobranchus ocellatus TaxID=259542 RepID=A0AAV4DXT9_9GAST|nr:serine/threonine-protein kinase pak 6 [Plakobranchus ocellatus]